MEKIDMTREEAQRLYVSNWWKGKSATEIAVTQLQLDRLIVPFSVFHEALEKACGHAVYTHEMAGDGRERLWRELTQKGGDK